MNIVEPPKRKTSPNTETKKDLIIQKDTHIGYNTIMVKTTTDKPKRI